MIMSDQMPSKRCFKCQTVKPLEEFYAHPRMADGRLNKCKACTKLDVRANYRTNKGHYQRYERGRAKDPKRVAKAAECLRNNPVKRRARRAVHNAVRDGRLSPLPCEVCGCLQVQGHHEDYSKPLDVAWLCFEHHRARHGQVADGSEFARCFKVKAETEKKAA